MDPSDLNVPPSPNALVFPLGDFMFDEPSESSRISTEPSTFSPDSGTDYRLSDTSFFDAEYINPAILEGTDTTATDYLTSDGIFPEMQYTQYELSPYHPDWQPPATDIEQQQQNFQIRPDINSSRGVFPNAPDTSARDDMGCNWTTIQQGGFGPTGNSAFSHEEHFGAFSISPPLPIPSSPISQLLRGSLAPMRCEWPSCKKVSFSTKKHFTRHLRSHRDDLVQEFVGPDVCPWPGCRSRKSRVEFQTKAEFAKHLKLHMKYHWCDVPDCNHGEGFARQPDLKRHLKTHLKEPAFNCPDSSCSSSSLGFSRKDKLDDHIRTRHPHLVYTVQSRRCNVHGCTVKKLFASVEELQVHFAITHEPDRPHCCPVLECTRSNNGFTTRGKLIEYIKSEHNPPKCKFDHCDFRSLGNLMVEHIQHTHNGIWECRLPGCEGSNSQFTYDRFGLHIRNMHNINYPQSANLKAASRGDIFAYIPGTLVTCGYCSWHRSEPAQNKMSTNEAA